MNRRTSSLINDAEKITLEELCLAPELPSLVTLDASLLAAINLLEFHNPGSGFSRSGDRETTPATEEQIAESICILAGALRANLSAYYAAIRNSSDEYRDQQEVAF
jgi:hypothetical protein